MLLTRSPLSYPLRGNRVRLACVRHAASVDSEPGSNSHVKACFDYPKAIKQTINASSLLIIGSALLLLLSEYPRAPESKPPAPCWLILDGLSASAPCGASARLCLHVLFSFQRTDPAQRASAIPDAHSPRLAGPDQPRIGRIQGNLLRLLQPLSTVNPHPPPVRTAACKSQSGRHCGLGGTFRPAVRPGSPETRELGDYERRRRNSILRAEEGLVNPGPGAYHPRKNCLTYGRSTLTRI